MLSVVQISRTDVSEINTLNTMCCFLHTHSVFANRSIFYPRDAMLAQVFAIATCPSVCLSVRHTPVLWLAEQKQDREMYTFW